MPATKRRRGASKWDIPASRIVFLPEGWEPPPPAITGRPKGSSADLDPIERAPKRFDWTKEELHEAVQLGLDRLYLDDAALDAYLPRALHLDRVAVSVQRAKKRLGEEACQRMSARYGNG